MTGLAWAVTPFHDEQEWVLERYEGAPVELVGPHRKYLELETSAADDEGNPFVTPTVIYRCVRPEWVGPSGVPRGVARGVHLLASPLFLSHKHTHTITRSYPTDGRTDAVQLSWWVWLEKAGGEVWIGSSLCEIGQDTNVANGGGAHVYAS